MNEEIRKEAVSHWNSVAKPLHSLGKLEDYIAQIAQIQGTPKVKLDRRRVLVFCADNGIVEEGVTQSEQNVTALVAENIGRGCGNICTIAKTARCEVMPVDVGIAVHRRFDGVWDRKTAFGTKDFVKEPAMSAQEALDTVRTGFSLAKECKDAGFDILCTGEMGIGNTTTSTAIVSSLLRRPASELVGRGAGLNDTGFQKKRQVIEDAVQKYGLYQADPFKVLACVGGFDIAAMTGLYLGASSAGIPVVLDGCVTAAAALLAERILPGTKDVLIPSHQSKEKIAPAVFDALGLTAVIHADMALGEGTGAVMMLHLLDSALAVYNDGSAFSDIHLEAYQDLSRTCNRN